MEFRDLKKQYQVLKKDIDNAVQSLCENAQFIGGAPVKELESALADYVGVKHCITCANGTDALSLAAMAWGIGPGDAVFVPDFTYFASGEIVAFEGATPIFVDVCKDTYNIDPDKLEETIENYLPKELFKPYDENAVNNAVVETSAEEKDITPEPVEEKIIPDFVTEIKEINVASGLKYLGNEEMYMEVLKTYAGDLGGIVSDIEKFYWSGDLRSFTIKVHALKSSTRSIGGTELGDRAQELETAGDDGDKAFIDSRIEDFLISFRNLEEKLSPLVESNSDSGDLTPMTMEEVQAAYEKIKKALDAFEFNDADDIVAELNSHIVPESEQERCKALKQAADDFDYVAMADVFEN